MLSSPLLALCFATLAATEPATPDGVPERFAGASTDGVPTPQRWWATFSDAELVRYVEEAQRDNLDLQASRTRVEEADAVVRQSLGPLLPTLTWDTSGQVAPFESLGFQFVGAPGGGGGMPGMEPPNLYYTGSTALNLGYQVDLTGRATLQRKAAKRDRSAAQQDIEAQTLSLSAEISSAYFDVVAARAQVREVDAQIAAQQDLLSLTELRFQHGQATALEVLQQRQQLASVRTLGPQAAQQAAAASQRLNVLLGRSPEQQVTAAEQLPQLKGRIDPGRPEAVLATRPDVQAARTRAESAELRLKSDRRAFAPTLRLSSQAGIQAIRITDTNSQTFWNAGAVFSVPLYLGGQAHARMKQTEAAAKGARIRERSTELEAMRQVEEALVADREQAALLAAQVRASEAASAAYEEAKHRYSQGLSDYLSVLTALNSASRAKLDTIRVHRERIAARTRLFRALGAQ